jgi:drug/metabolite transporter (DMT)-like permease
LTNSRASTTPHARGNLQGVAVMILAVGTFSLMDSCLKLLSPHYSTLEIACLRGLSTLPFVLVWISLTSGFAGITRIRLPLHVLRGALGIMMVTLFTFGVRNLPLSDAYSIFFVAPLFITAFAAMILHERVDRRRWIAIGVGFAGVLIVLRPSGGSAITLPGVAIIVTAIGYALSAITGRVLTRTDSTQSMVLWLMTFIALGSGILAFPSWQPLRPEDRWVVVALGLSGSIGQWAITEAFRHGEASFIAPFEYTALVWGVLLDRLIWRTSPETVTIAGASVIIASGIYLVRREQVHAGAEHP